jgi:hypothetical protein
MLLQRPLPACHILGGWFPTAFKCLCRHERRLLEANADGSQLAALDDTGNMSVYALYRGQASTIRLDFQAEGVSSLAWNTDHAEVHL